VNVIKLGGSLLDDKERRAIALRAIANERDVVLVHGGGKHVDARLAQLGIAKRTHAGLRITDDATLDVVVAVLAGAVNKMLVSELAELGVKAAGISGVDAATIVAEQHPPIDGIELGHVGRVTGSDPTLVRALLASGILPVVSSVAQGPSGTLLNVNADSAACALAVALGATSLRFLTDVDGLLDASGSLVSTLTPHEVEALITSGVVSGGMRPKVESAVAAIARGVGKVAIGGTELVAA
jgi:acetylglutamate kinase